jgi:hypothetical protein
MNTGLQNNPYVGTGQCIAIGKVLSGYTLNESFLQRPFLHQQSDDETIARACFFSVAICHQTHQLYNTDLNLYGWDYLEYVFTGLSNRGSITLDPCWLASADKNILMEKFAQLFPRGGTGSVSSLDSLDERICLLKNSALFILSEYNNSVLQFLKSTESRLINSGFGYYEQLIATDAFADPLCKKSTFLLKLLADCAVYHIIDTENLVPIMDYHMQRVLLRNGAIEVPDEKLAASLRNRTPLQSDQSIRVASIEAMRKIARSSGHSLLTMNDIFWPLGRSCCLDNPLCISGLCEKNPCTLTRNIRLDHHSACILEPVCRGAMNQGYRDFWQPEVVTHFY